MGAEGQLRLTTSGKSPAVADPRQSRRDRVADAGGVAVRPDPAPAYPRLGQAYSRISGGQQSSKVSG